MNFRNRLKSLECFVQERTGEECVNPRWVPVVRAICQTLLLHVGHEPGRSVKAHVWQQVHEQLVAIDHIAARVAAGDEPDPQDLNAIPEGLRPDRIPRSYAVAVQGPLVPWRLRHTVGEPLSGTYAENDIEAIERLLD